VEANQKLKEKNMKKIIIIAACLSLLPLTAMAAKKPAAKHTKASVAACVGKAVGDSVELKGKKGKKIAATCQEVKGKLVAVPGAAHAAPPAPAATAPAATAPAAEAPAAMPAK
jgi:hypothetical protein